MSAIFGILRFDGGEVSPRDLERMGNVLAHRGPDGRKFIAHGPAGLGHCLMRVNNEDLFEAQPLHDRDTDVTLVADCRIDNREELARTFGWSDADCRDKPDSAFILEAYKTWGEDAAGHLLGDFAYAVWDGRARKLVLARDHMGQRNVHYHHGPHAFAFATEAKGLWALPDVPRELDELALGRHLVLDARRPPGATLFRSISGLAGGTVMSVRHDGGANSNRYWVPEPATTHLGRDEAYYVTAYRRVLAEAVECRIRRLIRPPALLLSAGFDSAAIAAMCGPVMLAQGRRLITISSVLPQGHGGAGPDVRPWVEFCRRDMSHLDVNYFVREVGAFDSATASACRTADAVPGVACYILDGLFRMAAARGARLVLDGVGGDATLNPLGDMALPRLLRAGRLRRFCAELWAYRHATGMPVGTILRRRVLPWLLPYRVRRKWWDRRGFGLRHARRFVDRDYLNRLEREGVGDMPDPPGLQEPLAMRERNRAGLKRAAQKNRHLQTNEAAARGLELSRPMLDKRAVEFGLAIPEDLYFVGGRSRHLARRALRDLMPVEYQDRTARQDPFDPDIGNSVEHVRDELRDTLERMAGSASLPKMFDLEALARLPEGLEPLTRAYALRAFRAAQYVAWIGGENLGDRNDALTTPGSGSR